MAKRSLTKRIAKRNNFISEESIDVCSTDNNIKERRGLIKLENAVGKPIVDVLQEFGELNLQLKDIAVLVGVPTKRLKEMLEQGEKDFEENLDSSERDMFIAYTYGKKTLEASTVLSLMKKSPDKLLEKLNPEVYSDEVSDKYEMPTININVSDRKEVDLEAITKRVMDRNEAIKNGGENKDE